MKLDFETIIVLQIVMKELSNGIDPTSSIAFPEDSILNSSLLKKCFSEASDIFGELGKHVEEINRLSMRKITNRKSPFYICEDDLKKIPISDTPVSISKFTYSINEICSRKDMKKLRATQITQWLEVNGYLQLVCCKDGVECRAATESGKLVGITSIEKENSRGEGYITNMYDFKAQKFIVDCVLPQIVRTVTISLR